MLRRRLGGIVEPLADPLGNLWASAGPEEGLHVVAVGHADQIGMIVTYVQDDGFVRFDAVGQLDQQLLPGHTVLVHGAGGPVRGVVGRPPTQIVPEEDRGKAVSIKEQYIDIGAANRAAALERIAVGDPITFDQGFVELAPGRLASLALDDRVGVYAAFRALELYSQTDGAARLTAISSAHEETTYMGARALAHRLRPDCVIVVDGEFASDYPASTPSSSRARCAWGQGQCSVLALPQTASSTALALEVAAAEGIAVQTRAYAGCMFTDADELAAAGMAASLALSIPMRYVHSAAEVADEHDIEDAALLIEALTHRLAEVFAPDMFTPGGRS